MKIMALQPIKVHIVNGEHSKGRGVGFYTENLIKALSKLHEIVLDSPKPELIHYPFFDLFYHTLPFRKSKPTVVTIHDLTPLVMAARYPKGIKGSINLALQRLALTNISAIITDSFSSKKDITDIFSIPEGKVFVTPLAVDSLFSKALNSKQLSLIKKRYHLPEKFVLCVAGGPNPNKNLPLLAQATKELDIPLVLVGKGLLQEVPENVHPELIDLLDIKSHKHIQFPGFVPTEDLVGMYQLATVYCQPSLYEGFGLTLLEAMTVGCLIVSSDSSSLPEIYHETANQFNPLSLDSLKKSLTTALELPFKHRQINITQGKERAKYFSWEKTAKETLKVYNSVLCR